MQGALPLAFVSSSSEAASSGSACISPDCRYVWCLAGSTTLSLLSLLVMLQHAACTPGCNLLGGWVFQDAMHRYTKSSAVGFDLAGFGTSTVADAHAYCQILSAETETNQAVFDSAVLKDGPQRSSIFCHILTRQQAGQNSLAH